MTLSSFWQRLPVIVRSIFIGGAMATLGTVPWAILVSLNIRYWSALPWAVPLTILYLWIYWRFAKGILLPKWNKETRRSLCRAHHLPGEVMSMALFAGALGLVALILIQNVMNRMVRLPQQPTGDVSKLPIITILLLLVMSAVVAGVTEEISFRGYMQGPIERRHGPVIAILLTGFLFGFAHFSHTETTLSLMPFYIGVAVIYGSLAYLTNSILPGLILHAGGNMLGSFNLFVGGRAEWQTTASPPPLIWKTGPDSSFWISCLIAAIMVAAAIWAYHSLATLAKEQIDISSEPAVDESI